MNLEQLKYPIGKFIPPDQITVTDRATYINDIEALPPMLREVVSGLSEEQLDTPYREDGWTIRQVVHHIPDSHLNSYIRFRWALTEPEPLIKAYNEKAWAMLPDAISAPVEYSLSLLESLHRRWVLLLRELKEEDWKKSFEHPETNKIITLDLNLSLYSWHGKHHLAHITNLIARQGW